MKNNFYFLFAITFLFLQGCCSDGSNKKGTMVYAGQCGAVLNSDVYAGGGADDTDALQAILDRAPRLGRLHLVLDGAARISRTLKIHSNTTIECPDKSCGIFLSDSSNCNILCNADPDMKTIRNRNITLIGGVYNQNSPGQVHHREEKTWNQVSNLVMGMSFYGVEHVTLRDVTIANQRSWAMIMANWKYVTMDDIHIDRREREDHQNQDGLHFWGPGRFLTLRNIHGNSGDDFIALAPDEEDLKSSIEDVLIHGVQLEEADQGIRLLVRGEGKLDRVIIRDVTGTYRSYGFYISPWFKGSGGNYGNIVFDMVDLRPMKNNYEYTPPFLFKICGNIESLTLKNIYRHTPDFNHQMFLIGGHYVYDRPATLQHPGKIDRLIVDGLYIDERNENGVPDSYFRIKSDVGFLSINNVIMQRAEGLPKKGSLIQIEPGCTVGELRLNNISTSGLETLIDARSDGIKTKKFYNVN
ncbi:MAG: glycosyl hydrolase family 28 protein [Candidatus Azobacteroides sp.]|nr:glycosyl hydrolase family 28 protein [Candidatus Azobacteroides sp.]